MSSGLKINATKFGVYAMDTAQLFVINNLLFLIYLPVTKRLYNCDPETNQQSTKIATQMIASFFCKTGHIATVVLEVCTVKKEILKQIERRFGHIEGNYLIAMSCLLDPRFKNIHF